MTSQNRALPGFLLSALLTSLVLQSQPVFADENSEIRDRINRGNVLLSRRQFQEAIKEYEAVLQIQPNYAIAKSNIALTHNNWGIYLYSQRKYAEAKEHWETSLKLNPADGNVRRNLKIVADAQMRNPPAEKPAQDNNPKPTGPQDWNPFDESLDKVLKPAANNANNSNANAGSGPATAGSTPGNSTNTTTVVSSPNMTPPSGGTIISGSAVSPFSSPGSSSASFTTANTGSGSGAVIILGGSSTPGSSTAGSSTAGSSTAGSASVGSFSNSQTGTSNQSAGFGSTDANSGGAVRILGGTSGGASIVGGSTVSGGGKSFIPNTTSSTTTAAPTPSTKIPTRANGSSVPMSWPGAEDTHAPMSNVNKSTQTSGGAPKFLSRDDDKSRTDESSNSDSSNIEGLLAQIETKVYGKVSKNMPILKRIEKLEIETMGKKKSGSVSDRLKELKETYGL
jgi:hypothetical protein